MRKTEPEILREKAPEILREIAPENIFAKDVNIFVKRNNLFCIAQIVFKRNIARICRNVANIFCV